jgi:hypothetical protein
VAKDHARQCSHRTPLAVNQLLCSQCGPSSHKPPILDIGQPSYRKHCVPKCYQSVYCCLIGYFLIEMRIAKCFTNINKRFRCKCSKINICFGGEYTIFAPAQLLRNWREHRPSNKCDLDLNTSGEGGRILHVSSTKVCNCFCVAYI